MPWRGPEEEGEVPTLGYLVADFIETSCVVPDGDMQGQKYLLTDEMLRFVLLFYRIDPKTGKFFYFRGGQLVRPQKWGKGPFSAALICAEAYGPVLFDGWDADGDPVGRPWATPHIQVTAVSEDQTDNVWRSLQPMIELGDLKADIPDTGLTRINIPGGGLIEPVTSSARSRLGQRVTFCVQDETHSWTKDNGGRRLADNQRRNLAGMGGRWMETTNAWDPVEESVAQQTFEGDSPGVFKDDVDPGSGSVRNKRDRAKMLPRVYGDSYWVDLERIDGEIVALIEQGDPEQAERFFLNRKRAQQGAAFDIAKWRNLADVGFIVPDKSIITIGVDGARFEDALGVVATDVRQGYQFVLGAWEVPPSAPEGYEHPLHEVDGVMLEAFSRYEVARVYVDPQWIDPLMTAWQARWSQVVQEWWTHRPTQIGYALRSYKAAIEGKDLSHDGSSVFERHISNARKKYLNAYDDERRRLWTLAKDRPGSPRKIDLAMAGCLSWEARSDAIAGGALNEPEKARSRVVRGY